MKIVLSIYLIITLKLILNVSDILKFNLFKTFLKLRIRIKYLLEEYFKTYMKYSNVYIYNNIRKIFSQIMF